MARKQKWTDEQVEAEITRLKDSEFTKLGRKEEQIKYRRRQYMWRLQLLEARGKQLASQGINFDNIETELFGNIEEEDEN